jgi:thiol:disulfide interchange protein
LRHANAKSQGISRSRGTMSAVAFGLPRNGIPMGMNSMSRARPFLFALCIVLTVRLAPMHAQPDPFDDEFQAKPTKTVRALPHKLPADDVRKSAKASNLTTQKMLAYVDIKASAQPLKVKRGQIAQIVLDGQSKPYAYTYSAIKRHARQSGLGAKIGYKEAPWLKPLFPIHESEAELKTTKFDTSYILHDRFQWKQDVYISPDAPSGTQKVIVQLRLQVCTKRDEVANTFDVCLPPSDYVPLEVTLDIADSAAVPAPADLETRLTPIQLTEDPPARFADMSALLFSAFLGAILMLLTPCVFPMIPITVNFFIKQAEKEHHRPFFMASVYAGTIVVLLTAVILLVGKSIIDLANEPWFNLGLGIVLVLFALGLFGMFEVDLTKFFGAVLLLAVGFGLSYAAKRFIPFFTEGNKEFVLAVLSIAAAVPVTMLLGKGLQRTEAALGLEESALLNFFARQESKGGILGAGFMAMTFTITSFSCTGPFLGILLAPLAGSSFTQVQLLSAALVYAVTFAAPFFLLALFPTYLKRLPKSGGWMTTIKVTMGFLEIGAALKFLANVDLFWFPGQPQLFNYDTVLCSWIALSLACSLYLFGFYHLHHDTPEDHIGVPRMIFASLFMGMALYLAPLLFGVTPTGLVMESAVAFLPPDLKKHGDIDWVEDDYKTAWKVAKAEGKLIFIDFTGQNCANCRANERNAFRKPSVVRELKNFVCLQLFTDSVPNVDLTSTQARAQAKVQQDWQIGLVNDVTNPLYVIFEPDPSEPFEDGLLKGRVVNQFQGLITNVREFANLLETARAFN